MSINLKTNYFTVSGLAKGQAFCNREKEQKQLLYNIDNGTATLVISPRRYGKTSLIYKVLTDAKISFSYVDLYKAVSEQDIVDYILHAIGALIGKLEPKTDKFIKLATELFSDLQVSYSNSGLNIELKRNNNNLKPAENIITSVRET